MAKWNRLDSYEPEWGRWKIVNFWFNPSYNFNHWNEKEEYWQIFDKETDRPGTSFHHPSKESAIKSIQLLNSGTYLEGQDE